MDGKFIQLGERKKGRIVKNEQYTLKQFIIELRKKLLPKDVLYSVGVPGLFERLNKKKMQAQRNGIANAAYNHGWQDCINSVNETIKELINADNKGKTKKK